LLFLFVLQEQRINDAVVLDWGGDVGDGLVVDDRSKCNVFLAIKVPTTMTSTRMVVVVRQESYVRLFCLVACLFL
jgi:hypothetical protein